MDNLRLARRPVVCPLLAFDGLALRAVGLDQVAPPRFVVVLALEALVPLYRHVCLGCLVPLVKARLVLRLQRTRGFAFLTGGAGFARLLSGTATDSVAPGSSPRSGCCRRFELRQDEFASRYCTFKYDSIGATYSVGRNGVFKTAGALKQGRSTLGNDRLRLPRVIISGRTTRSWRLCKEQ